MPKKQEQPKNTYESDESSGPDEQHEAKEDEDSNSEGELQSRLAQEKQRITMNDTWGKKRKQFYGKDSSGSENEADEEAEAKRLQQIRAQKLARAVQDQEKALKGELKEPTMICGKKRSLRNQKKHSLRAARARTTKKTLSRWLRKRKLNSKRRRKRMRKKRS